MRTCQECGTRMSDTAEKCRTCGAQLPPVQKKCANCGIVISSDKKFCFVCEKNAIIKKLEAPPPKKQAPASKPVSVAAAAPVSVAPAEPVSVATAEPVTVAPAAPVAVATAEPVTVATAAPVAVAIAAPVSVAPSAPVSVAPAPVSAAPTTKKCAVCGAEFPLDANFCNKCGYAFNQVTHDNEVISYTEQYDVFISYRRDGGEAMSILIRDRLVAKGFNVFLDIENLNSGSFNNKLLDVIDNCKDVVLICSKNCLDRCVNEGDWVRKEIVHAFEKKKNIVPIMLRGFEFPEELPYDLEALRMQNGVNANSHEYFDAAMDRLATKFLKSTPVNAPAAPVNTAAVPPPAAPPPIVNAPTAPPPVSTPVSQYNNPTYKPSYSQTEITIHKSSLILSIVSLFFSLIFPLITYICGVIGLINAYKNIKTHKTKLAIALCITSLVLAILQL